MNSVASNSIVNLFKQTSKPRTKLFVQSIPPGFTEDEFKELIKKYLDEIDYFLFKPGKIIRDPYGHLIGLDNPDYGFATINFLDNITCPKFHREFHLMSLSDCYSNVKICSHSVFLFIICLDIKSKLIIEFALMQEIPSIIAACISPPSFNSFRDLSIYKDYLKTFPFAVKVEEERQSFLSHSIDLGDSSVANETLIIPNANELETKLSILPSPLSTSMPQFSYSSLLDRSIAISDSTEIVTALTEFIINSGMIETRLPQAKKNYEKKKTRKERKKEKKEKKEKIKEKKKEKKKANKSITEKKTFPTSTTINEQVLQKAQTHESQQAAPLKGVPKILARKPVQNEAAVPCKPSCSAPMTSISPASLAIKVIPDGNGIATESPSKIRIKSKGKTLSERSAQEPQKQPSIRPKDPTSFTNIQTPSTSTQSIEVCVESQKLKSDSNNKASKSFKVKKPEKVQCPNGSDQLENKSIFKSTETELIANPAVQTKFAEKKLNIPASKKGNTRQQIDTQAASSQPAKNKLPKQKQVQPLQPVSSAPNIQTAKKVFTTSAKQRDEQ